MSFFLTSTVSMLVVLGIMVLVHEFGHFAVAKLCGVRVEVFFPLKVSGKQSASASAAGETQITG